MFHTKIYLPQNLCTDLFIHVLSRTYNEESELLLVFFFPGWYIKVCLVFYLHPLITSTLHKIRGCCDAHCYVCFCSSNGYTEDGQNSQYSILMTKDLWDYNSNLGHLLILPFVQLLCLFRMQKQKDRTATHPAQKEFKFCLTPCTTL